MFTLLADKPARWYWGLIQVYSLAFSFASLLQTCVQFNEWPKRRHTPHKLLLAIPYFACTVAYRASAIALLCTFVGEFAAVPLVLIALAQARNSIYTILSTTLYRGISYYRSFPRVECPVSKITQQRLSRW